MYYKDLDEILLNTRKEKIDPGLETGYKTRTKYGVYSCPTLHILRIENRVKTKRHVFCSRKVEFTKIDVEWLFV